MAHKRIIRAKDIVNDIRGGMPDDELMQKYRLSAKGLASIFTKLEDSGTLKRSELYGRLPSCDDSADLGGARKLPRSYFTFAVWTHEAGNTANQGEVFDISERGVGVRGMTSKPGEFHTLVIDGSDVVDLETIWFQAVCRWTQYDHDGNCLAGFEIVTISDSDLIRLRKLIGGTTLG